MVKTVRNAPANGLLKVDVCIVGCGPAGLTLALELAGTEKRILLVESGGRMPTEKASACNAGSVDSPQGYPAHVLLDGRRRQLGGTANLWNHEPRGQTEKFIRCVPLDEEDFEKRDWLPLSGWPFPRSVLLPYYERAQTAFGIGPFEYDALSWLRDANRHPLLETANLTSSVSQFGLPRYFLGDAFKRLERCENVSLLPETNLLRLERDPLLGRIVAAELVDAHRQNIRVQAAVFILAAGGLENPRILLLNDIAQPGGLGNQNDLVGRCFMDHPSITLGTLVPHLPEFFEKACFYDQHVVDGYPIMGKLQVRAGKKQGEKLLNLYAVLVPRFSNIRDNLPFIFKELVAKGPQFLTRHRRHSPAGGYVGRTPEVRQSVRQRLLGGYFSECYCGWSQLANKAGRFGDFSVRALVELAPDPGNRVMLGEEVDGFGQRKLKIVWKWSDLDLQSIRRTQEIFRAELAPNIGSFIPVAETADTAPRAFYSTHHFMGTTRMHDDPKQGVVDANGRVHGIDNLFIAGSSVFPTGGCANPTLTIVALALRLADYLGSHYFAD